MKDGKKDGMKNGKKDGMKDEKKFGKKDGKKDRKKDEYTKTERRTEGITGRRTVRMADRRAENVRGEKYLFSGIHGRKAQVKRLFSSAFISPIKHALDEFKTTLRFAPAVVTLIQTKCMSSISDFRFQVVATSNRHHRNPFIMWHDQP